MGCEVFLSYSRADRPLAERLVQAAAARGVSVWFDEKIEGGHNWREDIVAALGEAKAMAILFSEHSNASRQLIKELAIADKLGKRVIPILVADCEPSGAYLYELASRNWISIHPNPEDRLESLVGTLITQLDLGAALPVAAATPLLSSASNVVALEASVAMSGASAPTESGRDEGSWFPLGRYDLYWILPILTVSFLLGILASGDEKAGGHALSTIASFVYMIVVGMRNARLNRNVFSKKSFASYVAILAVGSTPVLVTNGTMKDNFYAFFGFLVLSMFVALIANVLQVVFRRAFHLSAFRQKTIKPLGA